MKADKKLLIPSMSGFQYGYNTSIIAGALLFLSDTFSLSSFQQGLVAGAAMVGICIASFSTILSNYIGRKTTLFLSVLFFLAGCLLSALASEYHLLLAGRLFVGCGSGMAIVVAPTYLVEVAPATIRGAALNLNQIGISTGSLLAYLCSYFLSFSASWRWMFAIGILPAIGQMIGLFFIPESLNPEDKAKQLNEASWKRVIAPFYLSRLKLVLTLSLFQALSGANAVFFFAPKVFEDVGFVGEKALLSTILIGIIYVIAIFISFIVVDRLGRRVLLLSSFFGMGLSLLTIVFFSYIHSPWIDTISIFSILAYIAFFSLGVGPIPPLVVGEISPLRVRAHVMTLMGALGWVVNYLIAVTFLPALQFLNVEGTFLIYAIFCFIAFAIFFKMLPETKQKSLEEIELLFK